MKTKTNKIVKLSTHKNSLEKRNRKNFNKEAISEIKYCLSRIDAKAFTFVVWDGKSKSAVSWDISEDFCTHPLLLPELTKQLLIQNIQGYSKDV